MKSEDKEKMFLSEQFFLEHWMIQISLEKTLNSLYVRMEKSLKWVESELAKLPPSEKEEPKEQNQGTELPPVEQPKVGAKDRQSAEEFLFSKYPLVSKEWFKVNELTQEMISMMEQYAEQHHNSKRREELVTFMKHYKNDVPLCTMEGAAQLVDEYLKQ